MYNTYSHGGNSRRDEMLNPSIARLKEIANDEKGHQEKFRTLIGDLGGIPSVDFTPRHPATTIKQILEVNLEDEKQQLTPTGQILDELKKENGQGYYDHLLDMKIRHILMEEQEHITEFGTAPWDSRKKLLDLTCEVNSLGEKYDSASIKKVVKAGWTSV